MGMIRKTLSYAPLAFIIFMIAYRPEAAANIAGSILGLCIDFFNGAGTFISSVADDLPSMITALLRA